MKNNTQKFPSGEYALISRLQKLLPPSSARKQRSFELMIGDDAAVRVNKTAGEKLIITADVSVENIHFTLDTMTFEEIGYKSMVTNLSDCAAMGATPDSAVVQIVFPKNFHGVDNADNAVSVDNLDNADDINNINNIDNVGNAIESIYKGFAHACARWDFPIVGGDISAGANWMIAITLIGSISSGERVVKRTGIVDGDVLWMTGAPNTPGESAAGLACLQHFGREKSRDDADDNICDNNRDNVYGNIRGNIPQKYQRFVDAHISPTPRVDEGKLFAANNRVHAMMDLSDGLSKDIATLCYDNNLGFIFDDGLAPSPEMKMLSDELNIDWRDWFYHGGEEYELLLSCDPQYVPENCMRLGAFTKSLSGVNVYGRDDNCNDDDNGDKKIITLAQKSWDHARKNHA